LKEIQERTGNKKNVDGEWLRFGWRLQYEEERESALKRREMVPVDYRT